MIFLGVKDSGYISIKFTSATGIVESGLVGVSLIFLGTFIVILALAVKPPNQSIFMKIDQLEMTWSGQVYGVPRV